MRIVIFLLIAKVLVGCAVLLLSTRKDNPAVPPQPAPTATEGYYVGTWTTTDQQLTGALSCDVKQIMPDHWQGKFRGTYQHDSFEYTVEFCGDPVAGTVTINGATYDWTGTLTPGEFKIQFTGSRHKGHAEMTHLDLH